MENKEPKYQYHVLVWGGFFNEWNKKNHACKEGDYFFDTKEERSLFILKLMEISTKLNAKELCIHETEGYCCGIRTVLHRVVEWEGKRYYSYYEMGVNYPISSAKLYINDKWTCGFNDYPLGKDFDYEANPPKVIQEWITGAEQEVDFFN